MQRVKTSTAVSNLAAYTESGTPGYFTPGDAVAGTPATVPGAQWFNQVQEELLNVIKAADITPDATKDNQLAEAIAALIAAQAVTVESASETVAGILKLGTLSQALAGLASGVAVTPATLAGAILGGAGRVSTTGGTANAITGTLNAPQTALANGMAVLARASAANTGATTFDLTLYNGTTSTETGAKAVYDLTGSAVGSGAIAGAGHWLLLVYDTTLGGWVLVNPRQSAIAVDRRQTVLSGANASGVPAFLAAGTGLAVNLAATATPLVLTTAGGYGTAGAIDTITRIVADVVGAWSGLTASSTLYLYVDTTAPGSPTYGFSALAPVYDFVAPSSPATDQHWFDRAAMKMMRYSGSAWVAVQRVFVGECTTGTSSVSSVTPYAFRGEFVSPYSSALTAAATYTSANHNLGVIPEFVAVTLKCLAAEQGYSVGDIVNANFNSGYAESYPMVPRTRLTVGFTSGVTNNGWGYVHKTAGTNGTLTTANWGYSFIARRGW